MSAKLDVGAWRSMEFLSITQLAEVLRISYNKASELGRALPHVRIGSLIRISRLAVEKWIRDNERMNGYGC